jgi:hypothetical protein
MASKKPQNLTTISSIFEEPETSVEEVTDTTEVDEPVVVAPGAPAQRKARVKGTWTMYWSRETYNFEDGKTYTIPSDLYDYLKAHQNIYDTI